MTDLVTALRLCAHVTPELQPFEAWREHAGIAQAAADEIERLRNEVAALTADGPMMQRGIAADGSRVFGTMRECLDDVLSAAAAEARHGDELEDEIERLRAALKAEQDEVFRLQGAWGLLYTQTTGKGRL